MTMLKRTPAFALALLLTLATTARAHEKGTVTLSARSVTAGGSFTVRGEKLARRSAYHVQLRGVLNTYNLAAVRTDTAGRFEAQFGAPSDARAGNYTVVVVAADGDVVARAELGVTTGPAPMAGGGMGDMAGMAGHENMPGMAQGPHATAEMMEVPVNTTPLEWATIAVVVLLSGFGGVLLLQSAPSRRW